MNRRTFLGTLTGAVASAMLAPYVRGAVPKPVRAWARVRSRRCVWKVGAVGAWDDASCWVDGAVPADGDSVFVAHGHITGGVCPATLELLTIGEGARVGFGSEGNGVDGGTWQLSRPNDGGTQLRWMGDSA